MQSSKQAIFDAALALPEADRIALVDHLMKTLPDDPPEDAEFLAELDRRHEDAIKGTAGLIPWSELKKQL